MPLTWDYILKYVVVGEAACGKSSILIRLTDDRFLANPDPTIGVEFGSCLLTVGSEGKKVKIQCWDVAGSPSFRAITKSYYRGAAGALLVYDVNRRDTFLQTSSWLTDLRQHADPNVSIILIGNKVDLADGDSDSEEGTGTRQVSTEEGKAFAEKEGLMFLETSAKTGLAVKEAFDSTARDILEKIYSGSFETAKPSGIKLTNNSIPSSSSGSGCAC